MHLKNHVEKHRSLPSSVQINLLFQTLNESNWEEQKISFWYRWRWKTLSIDCWQKISKRIKCESCGPVLTWAAGFIRDISDCYCGEDKTGLVCQSIYLLWSCSLSGKSLFSQKSNKQARGDSALVLQLKHPSRQCLRQKKLSCSYFPSTRFHLFGYHPTKILSFPSTRDPRDFHESCVAHSSDLHAGSLIPLPCTPPWSCSPLSSMNGRLRPSPQPQCHGTRARPSAKGI